MINGDFSPWPSFSKQEVSAVSEVLLSNKVNYWTGSQARFFEKEFAIFSDASFAIALANGTVAIDLAMNALRIGKGDEVIVTSRTYIASVSSIVNSGATPIFVDVDNNSQNISHKNIIQAISVKTKAIICVHLAGWPCDMDPIIAIAKKNNLFVIEDCAQAHGAKYKGKSVGSIGDIGCWSFCQDKIMTTGGEGGMVTCNDELLWRKMWAYKDHGRSYEAAYERKHPPGFRWLNESFGTNYRMTEMQAVIGRIQLNRMPNWHKIRNQYLNKILNTAQSIPSLRVPIFDCNSCYNHSIENNCCSHAAYKCYVFIKPSFLKRDWTRDRIIEEINSQGVPCRSGSCSEVYLEKAFDNTTFKPSIRLKVAKELGETALMFLVHPTLTKNEIKKTCDILSNVMKTATNKY